MKKRLNRAFWPLAYIVLVLLVYVVSSLTALIRYQIQAPQKTDIVLAEQEYHGLKLLEAEDGYQKLVTSSNDTQIIYTLLKPAAVQNVLIEAKPDRPIGEMVLYYTTSPEQAFSEQRKIWAQMDEHGDWVFDLGGRRCAALRLDLDNRGGVSWQIGRFYLNEPVAVWRFFVPQAAQMFWLLLLPLAGLSVLSLLLEIAIPYVKKKRK